MNRRTNCLYLITVIALMAGLGLYSAGKIYAASSRSLHRSSYIVPIAQSTSDPLVFAFYYTWFDENTWNYDQLSDLPTELYVSRDRGVMGRHIDQAKAAGIDAFLVAWYGPSGASNQTEPNLAALLEEAAARQFKIGILFESDSPFMGGTGAVTGALQHALSVHTNHPAFLRVDGRPVIFFWRPTIYGVESWRAIRGQADPGYGSIWIAEGVDTNYLAVFDGHHLYSNTWSPPSDLTYINQKFANLVNQATQTYGGQKLWVSTVMPGYNDLRIRPNGGFARGREGGAYYERSWQAAINSQPDWVVITSFNEWPEGTYIEPSAAFGGHYLGLTAAWSGQFKARGRRDGGSTIGSPANAPISAAALPPVVATPPPAPSPTPYPEPDSPTAYVQATLLNLRAGPGTEPYAILDQVPTDYALAIIGQSTNGEWWQIRDGETVAWVAAAYVHAAGPVADVPIIEDAESQNVEDFVLDTSAEEIMLRETISGTTETGPASVNRPSLNRPSTNYPVINQPSTYQPKLSRDP